MSGKSKTQTVVENKKSDPWAPAQPGLQNILGKTTSLLDQNVGAGVYGGDRTAGLGSDTLAGLDGMKQGAAAGAPTASAGNGFVGGVLGNGGATAGTQAATSAVAGIDPTVSRAGVAGAVGRLSDPGNVAAATGARLAGGAFATDAAPLAGLAGELATGGTQTQRSLQDVADGKYLGGANPHLDAMIGRASNAAASQVAQRMAASGRYGSGRWAGATADAVAGVDTGLRYQDYEAERTRQAQAAGAIDATRNASAATAGSLYQGLAGINTDNAGISASGAGLAQAALRDAFSGQQALTGLDADNVGRRLTQAGVLLDAAQGDRQAGFAGVAALPTLQQALAQPGATLAGVGAVQDQARQADIDADMVWFNDTQTAPWKPVGLASSVVTPIASLGGESTGTSKTTMPQPSFLQQLLGFGLAGAEVGSKFLGK